MASTYELIETTTLSSSASSVTFSSITQDYRDLVLVVEITASGGEVVGNIRFNGDSGSNYFTVAMNGNGSSANSSTNDGTSLFGLFANLSKPRALGLWQVMDYSATDKHKATLLRRNNVDSDVFAQAGRYASTTAITSVEIFTANNNFASGSSFSLYGIAS